MSIQICPEARYTVFSLLSFHYHNSLLLSGTYTNVWLRSFLNARCQGFVSPEHLMASIKLTCYTSCQGIANCLETGSKHLHPSSASFPSLGHQVCLGGSLQWACLCSAKALVWPWTSCNPKLCSPVGRAKPASNEGLVTCAWCVELAGKWGQRGCDAASTGATHGAEVQSTAQQYRSNTGARQLVLKSHSGKTACGKWHFGWHKAWQFVLVAVAG